MFKKLPF